MRELTLQESPEFDPIFIREITNDGRIKILITSHGYERKTMRLTGLEADQLLYWLLERKFNASTDV